MKKENIAPKRAVGRPVGTTKENKKTKVIEFKLRIDGEEEEIIKQGFDKMGLNPKIRGSKKKFIMNLIKDYIK